MKDERRLKSLLLAAKSLSPFFLYTEKTEKSGFFYGFFREFQSKPCCPCPKKELRNVCKQRLSGLPFSLTPIRKTFRRVDFPLSLRERAG
jgi:hypothetical protein